MNYLLIAIIGLAGGLVTSAGEFAVITSTGLMTRLTGKTHTAKYIRLYEDAVTIGGSLFNALYVFQVHAGVSETIARFLIGILAIFVGIYVGCFAVALAEAVKATAIFSRRAKLQYGISFIVLAIAIGKVAGAMYQFFLL